MRVIFFASPEFSVPVLSALVGQGHDVCAVYSQPPRKKGRGHKMLPTPVHESAEGWGIPVHTPLNFKDDAEIEILKSYNADVFVVVAYGLILPKKVLDIPPLGAINIHASILPRWRGAAPIHRAIMAGDSETGITIMKMDEGCDTGDIAIIDKVPIPNDANYGQMHDVLKEVGAQSIIKALAALSRDSLYFKPQPIEGASYAKKISSDEYFINWNNSTIDIYNQARAFSPTPGLKAWVEIDGNKTSVKLFDVKPLSLDDIDKLFLSDCSEYKSEQEASSQNTSAKKSDFLNLKPAAIFYDENISPFMLARTLDGGLMFGNIQREGSSKQSIKDFYNGLASHNFTGFITS